MGLGRLLDPTQIGYEAEKLESDLKKRIVGQDEAVQQIINIYQTHLAGMSSPLPRSPSLSVLLPDIWDIAKRMRCSARRC